MWAPTIQVPLHATPEDPIATSSYFANNNGNSTNFASTSLGNTTTSVARNNPSAIQEVDDSSLFRTPLCPPRTIQGQSIISSAIRTGSSFNTTTSKSPGSSSTCTSRGGGGIEPVDRSTFVAVVEGRGLARGEIGIACMNTNTPTLILCQFNDTQRYMKVISKINIFRPYEILMNATSCDPNNPSQLYLQLQKEVSNVKIVPIQRRIFNEAKGLQKINSLVAELYVPVIHTITNKYYCLSASHALLKYVELVHSTIFSPRTLRIDFQGCEQTCMIDHVTSQHLELLQNNQQPSSNYSLLGIINTCKTPNGARLLRMNILQPTCDPKIINSRLDSVEEIMKEREMLVGLQDILGRLPIDIEHVMASLVQIPKVDNARIAEQRINYVIALKHILELVPTLSTLLESSENEYFQSVRADLLMPEFDSMLQSIKRVLHDEAQFQKGSVNMKRQRCFAVKADINPILDIARKAYCELIDDINNYVLQLSRDEGISFRLGTNNQRGFYVQFYISDRSGGIPPLPTYFLQVRQRGNFVTFTTEVLISLDHRAQEVLKEIENLSSIVISELITVIRNDIGILYKVSDAIGNLDLLFSLANYALTTPRSIRPNFTKDTTSITMGRHPILDSISADPSVPNNTFLSDCANFMLITGPNMSGKTTYIKHVALLQVLAQLGSFVPADAASFRIANNIMSRLGTGDNIEENSSSFALEMTETTYILQHVCKNSLIIIDELGRATSNEEGAAISWAIAEALLANKAFVLFATHHLLLTKLESMYSNVFNYKMETEEWEVENSGSNSRTVPSGKLNYTHVIKRGVTDVEHYGLKLAMNTCYPSSVIAAAMSMSKKIMADRGIEQFSVNQKEITDRRNKVMLSTHLRLAANSLNEYDDANVEVVREYLETLQQEFRRKIEQDNLTSVENRNNPEDTHEEDVLIDDDNNDEQNDSTTNRSSDLECK